MRKVDWMVPKMVYLAAMLVVPMVCVLAQGKEEQWDDGRALWWADRRELWSAGVKELWSEKWMEL